MGAEGNRLLLLLLLVILFLAPLGEGSATPLGLFILHTLVLCGAVGGGLTGLILHAVARSLLSQMFGQDVPRLAGGFEGLAIGAAAGLGYALATPRPHGGGMATPRGGRRLAAALATGACCAAAGVIVIHAGGSLVGTSLNLLADAYRGSQVGLTPMARLLGEAEAGPLTQGISAAIEGLFFGSGLAFGLTRRPRQTP